MTLTVFYCDTLLIGSQYVHLRKSINDHKYIVITIIGIRKAIYTIHGDGIPRQTEVGKGVYRPCFLMVGFTMV